MRRKSLLTLGLSMLLIVFAACGGDDDESAKQTTTTTTTTAPPTTAAPTTSPPPPTPAPTAPPTVPPTLPPTVPPTTAPPSPRAVDLSAGPNYVQTNGPSGAGCTPGINNPTLGQGWWAGEIRGIQGTTVDFDVVCYFAGAAATKAAAQDGQVATDDYYVRNSSKQTRKETFAATGTPAMCVGTDNRPFPCMAGDILDLYQGEGQTKNIGGREAYGFPILWIHNSGPGQADYAYVQFAP